MTPPHLCNFSFSSSPHVISFSNYAHFLWVVALPIWRFCFFLSLEPSSDQDEPDSAFEATQYFFEDITPECTHGKWPFSPRVLYLFSTEPSVMGKDLPPKLVNQRNIWIWFSNMLLSFTSFEIRQLLGKQVLQPTEGTMYTVSQGIRKSMLCRAISFAFLSLLGSGWLRTSSCFYAAI